VPCSRVKLLSCIVKHDDNKSLNIDSKRMSVRVDRYTVTDVSNDRDACLQGQVLQFLDTSNSDVATKRLSQQHVCRTKRLLRASKSRYNTDPCLVMRKSGPIRIKHRNTASGCRPDSCRGHEISLSSTNVQTGSGAHPASYSMGKVTGA